MRLRAKLTVVLAIGSVAALFVWFASTLASGVVHLPDGSTLKLIGVTVGLAPHTTEKSWHRFAKKFCPHDCNDGCPFLPPAFAPAHRIPLLCISSMQAPPCWVLPLIPGTRLPRPMIKDFVFRASLGVATVGDWAKCFVASLFAPTLDVSVTLICSC